MKVNTTKSIHKVQIHIEVGYLPVGLGNTTAVGDAIGQQDYQRQEQQFLKPNASESPEVVPLALLFAMKPLSSSAAGDPLPYSNPPKHQ
jgi:hypothetical protein